MLKPLSPKTLEKKYAELGLPKEKIELLHTYFLCFSNLYGVISLREAWDIFRHYEGTAVHKREFLAFSGVVQREAGLPYTVYELKEIYNGETTEDPAERMIVNNRLVSSGYYRFGDISALEKGRCGKPYFLPEWQVFLSFREDRFYLTPAGKEMKAFVKKLKTGGSFRGYVGLGDNVIRDPAGDPVKGKRLSEIVFFTPPELLDLEYFKSEAKKRKLREEYSIPASEKILNRIRKFLMVGNFWQFSGFGSDVSFLVEDLRRDYGVALSTKQLEKFMQLFTELNNSSNLWVNGGYSPRELSRRTASGGPCAVTVGPNMKELLSTGEVDEDELRAKLAEMGITLINS